MVEQRTRFPNKFRLLGFFAYKYKEQERKSQELFNRMSEEGRGKKGERNKSSITES
jgi:hypothetical protein